MSTAGTAYREVVEGGGRVVGIAPSVKERKWACLEGGKSDGAQFGANKRIKVTLKALGAMPAKGMA
jgi:hypothetical protein